MFCQYAIFCEGHDGGRTESIQSRIFWAALPLLLFRHLDLIELEADLTDIEMPDGDVIGCADTHRNWL